MPEHRFPVQLPDMCLIHPAYPAGRCGLEVVHQIRQPEVGVGAYKQVYVIGLAVKLQQFAPPSGAYGREDRVKIAKHGGRDRLSAVLRDQNQMILQVKDTMAKRF